MKHYRCQCGKETGFGSMPFPKCSGCRECNTTLEWHPAMHKPVADHKFEKRFSQKDGLFSHWECSACHCRVEGDEDAQPDPTKDHQS